RRGACLRGRDRGRGGRARRGLRGRVLRGPQPMRAGTRVALYGLLLVALFLASYLLAGALVPEAWVTGWAGSGHCARTAALAAPRESATPHEREDPHHDHSPGPVPAGRRHRARDRRDDLRLVRQP